MQIARRASILLLSLAFLPSKALAWNATGHMVIAEIAYAQLTPKVRTFVDKLLKENPDHDADDFVSAGPWADDTRTKANGSWHYIDQYFSTDGTAVTKQPDAENVVWAINKFSKVLADKSASSADRAQALRYLIHFVGDIHQPLHCVSRITADEPNGDRGGNDFLFAKREGRGRVPELHAFWDDGGGAFPWVYRPLSDSSNAEIRMIALRAVGATPKPMLTDSLKRMDPTEWATEGLALSKSFVYSTPEFSSPSASYTTKTRTICYERVAIAGGRLAMLLNSLLKSE